MDMIVSETFAVNNKYTLIASACFQELSELKVGYKAKTATPWHRAWFLQAQAKLFNGQYNVSKARFAGKSKFDKRSKTSDNIALH